MPTQNQGPKQIQRRLNLHTSVHLLRICLDDVAAARRLEDKIVVLASHLTIGLCFPAFYLLGVSARSGRRRNASLLEMWRSSLFKSVEVSIMGVVLIIRPNTGDILQVFHNRRLAPEPGVVSYLWLHEPGTFVDVGANIGFYTLMVALKMGNRGTVVAIEPSKDNFEALQSNIRRNGCENVVALNLAAFSEDRKMVLRTPPEPWDTGKFSLVESVYYGSNSGELVDARRLDRVLNSLGINGIDCLKMDVEGAEAHALRGLGGYLGQCGAVIFEAWTSDQLAECKRVLSLSGDFNVEPMGGGNFLAVPV
jgi:FkbM family methyltransferase